MHKNVPFHWDSACQSTFEKFKQLVVSAPILGVPKADEGFFILTTDGSLKGVVMSNSSSCRYSADTPTPCASADTLLE